MSSERRHRGMAAPGRRAIALPGSRWCVALCIVLTAAGLAAATGSVASADPTTSLQGCGGSCDGQDPDTTECDATPVDLEPQVIGEGFTVELRNSPSCHADWARVTGDSPFSVCDGGSPYRVTSFVRVEQATSPDPAAVTTSHTHCADLGTFYTDMVDDVGWIRACLSDSDGDPFTDSGLPTLTDEACTAWHRAGSPPGASVSSTSYTGPTTGTYGHVEVLSGRLVDAATSRGLGGEPLAFKLGAQSCIGTTEESGVASCSITLQQAPGDVTVRASFAGDATYNSSADSQPFAIVAAATSVSYSGSLSSEYYEPFTAAATLADRDDGTVISGQTISFTIGGIDGCSAMTDAAGRAACSIAPTQPAGDYQIAAQFTGTSLYQPSSDVEPFSIMRAQTTTSLGASPSVSSPFGQPVTFTSLSAPHSPGAPRPTGSATFTVDSTLVGSSSLAGGSTSIVTAALSAGQHTIEAAYGGDRNYLASAGEFPYLVTCDLNVVGTVDGSLAVTTTTCLSAGARVTGALAVEPGGALDVEGAQIDGAITASGAGVIRVCDSSIDGAVDVKNATGLVLVGDPGDAACQPNAIGGTMDLKNDPGGVEALDNTVGGAVLADRDSGPGPYPGDATTISGNHGPQPAAALVTPGLQGAEPGAHDGDLAPAQPSPSRTTAAAVALPAPSGSAGPTPTPSAVRAPRLVARPPRIVSAVARRPRRETLAAAIARCAELPRARRKSCVAVARSRYARVAEVHGQKAAAARRG